MKIIPELLSDLRDLDIKLWVDGNRLRYSAPDGALTPELRARLTKQKTEVLAFLLESNLADPSTLLPIGRISRTGDLPLSFAQQRLWFLDQLAPGNPFYNIPAAVRLDGALDVEVLHRSLNEIVRRHEVLRTTFPKVDGVPSQVIAAALALPLPVIDLQDWPDTEQTTEMKRLAEQECQRPFDLATGPLLRSSLLRLTPRSHVLLVTIHHIVADGWSMGVLIQELAALYTAFCEGRPSPLPELSLQYVDFAHWQRHWLQGQVLEQQLHYWRGQLAEAPPLLELPTDHPHPPLQSFRGGLTTFALDPHTSDALKELSQQAGATLFMTLLAAFAAFLSRYSHQPDVVIGSGIANRNRADIEPLIGFFVNTLALRVKLHDNPSFRQLLQQVRAVALEAYAHQDVPFERLVEELQPERHLSHSPVFQVAFVFQNAPMEALRLPGLTLAPVELEAVTAKFDLTLFMWEGEHGLEGSLEYNRDVFEPTTIARMLQHWRVLLQGIVAQPGQRVEQLPLLPEAEHGQLVVEWNQTQHDWAQDLCIHQQVAAWAARAPAAVAVASPERQLTYAELEQRANQLAHYLRQLGVGAEDVVAVCLERSVELIVAWLAILKAGGAYLPLDPAYPSERLNYLLADAEAAVVITCQALGARLQAPRARLLCLDQEGGPIAQAPTTAPEVPVLPAQLAYIIYTSGSTGTPKGVLVPHQGLINLVAWHHHAFALTQASRTTQLAGVAFDAATWEVWASLSAGATLYLAPPELVASPARLQAWLLAQAITLTFLPTPLAEAVLQLPWPAEAALRTLLTGGDTLHPLPATPLPFQVVNNYGPTENSVVSTSARLALPEDAQRPPTIGRAIANVEVYLLDRHLRPVPLGVAGELYLGGAGLARGYQNRPALTAECFIPHPFGRSPGGRLYRTGDVARYRNDGRLEFLGRSDDQVKIRGFRIEPGEIEAILAQHPAVAQAVVVAQGEAEHARLVAYAVAKPRVPSPSPADLRRFLKARLPEYLVPTGLVWLETLPLTPNGKLDRRRLPPWGEDPRALSEAGYVAPESETEQRIARIWQEVLHLEQVGVQDNFFDLGGNSLLLAQANNKLQAGFQPARADGGHVSKSDDQIVGSILYPAE